MIRMNFNSKQQRCGGAILENPIPLRTMMGWMCEDGEPEPEEKCDFTPI